MNETMKCNAGHDVNEQGCDLVEAVEHERVTPHDDSHSIIAKGETVCCSEESFGAWKSPYAERYQKVDKVAQIREEVMHSLPFVGEDTDRHEI